ncbi:MAG: glycosyltransferase family 1 protein [wastewater metagenome]|nr:glycosyltransferase family 1 protein [Candidatus Loosdrechtia aerotolerans]
MKIAFISQPWNNCPPVKTGSVSVWIYEVARRVAKAHEVVVYACNNKVQKKEEYDEHERIHYRRVSISPDKLFLKYLKRFPMLNKNHTKPLFASQLYYLGFIAKIANDLRKQKCDIVHIQNFSQFVPIIKALNPGIKIVLHMHCDWLVQLDRFMIENRLRQVDLIMGCSEYVTRKIRTCFPQFAGRCQTIYNGVDIDHFIPGDESALKEKNGTKRLLFVGRITPEKGIHVLLEAFQIIVKHYPQTSIEIIGPDDKTPREFIVDLHDNTSVTNLKLFYTENYLSQLRTMLPPKLTDHVTFSGHIQQEYLQSKYSSASILVNPSLSESFGMSLIEAMATKIPVVATRVGGMTEVVEEDKTGILVEPGNVSALAEAILRLLSDEDERRSMGDAGRKRAVDMFSWDRISEKLLYYYENTYGNSYGNNRNIYA